jgi:hypothetical protein
MSAFTGILGTKDSRLGSFVLGVGLASGAENPQSVTSTITVVSTADFTILPNPLRITVTSSVAVAQAIGHASLLPRSVAAAITVTQTILAVPSPYLNVTQEVVEVFYQTLAPLRVTQYVVEVFYRKAQENSVTSTIAVAQTIDLPERIVNITVTSAVGVASTGSGRDDIQRKTVQSTVAVASIIAAQGVNRQIVTSTITVASTAAGRNNNVRLSVASTVGVADTDSGRNASPRVPVSSTGNVLSVPTGRNNHPRVAVITIISTADFVADRNTNPRRTVTQGITVATTAGARVPHFFPISTITVAQTISQRNTIVRQTVVSTVAVAIDIADRSDNPRVTVTSAITIAVAVPPPIQWRTSVNRQLVFAFVAVTPTIVNNSTRQLVTSNVTVDTNARGSAYSQLVTSQIIVGTAITGGNDNRRVSVSEAITVTPVAGGANAVQRLNLTQAIQVAYAIGARGPIVTQSITDTIAVASTFASRIVAQHNVTSTVVLVDTVTVGLGPKRQTVTSTITVTPTIRDSPISMSVTSTGTVGQRIQELEPTITSRVTVTPVVNKTTNVLLTDSLTFVQDVQAPKTMTHTIAETLDLAQVLDRSVVWGRSLTDTLVFPDRYYIRATSISPDPIVVPVVTGTIVSSIVVLRSNPAGAITLPAPKFDDSRANVAGITIRRTMDGGKYSFVKSSDRQKLVWTFKISQAKAIELRDWITQSLSEELRITDWLGRVWVARMTINPPTLSADGRFAPEVEFTMVELQFDGVKISG